MNDFLQGFVFFILKLNLLTGRPTRLIGLAKIVLQSKKQSALRRGEPTCFVEYIGCFQIRACNICMKERLSHCRESHKLIFQEWENQHPIRTKKSCAPALHIPIG